jgi:hypothetical protein
VYLDLHLHVAFRLVIFKGVILSRLPLWTARPFRISCRRKSWAGYLRDQEEGFKKKTTSAQKENLDPLPVPVPLTTQRQNTTLIFVELSGWVTNRLNNPFMAGYQSKGLTSSNGERCIGVMRAESHQDRS